MQIVAEVGSAEGVWYENISADGGLIPLSMPESGMYRVILVHNTCLFSPVSVSAISLKHRKHPDRLSFGGEAARSEFIAVGIGELPLTAANAAGSDSLELFQDNPFDRMLLAQAKCERIKIMSHDRQFPQYGDFVIPG